MFFRIAPALALIAPIPALIAPILTLIAPILLGVEAFGVANVLPIAIVCIIAYIVNGNLSIYSSQQKALFGFEE